MSNIYLIINFDSYISILKLEELGLKLNITMIFEKIKMQLADIVKWVGRPVESIGTCT